MKVLLTGASGFIGSSLVRYILENKPDVEIVALTSPHSEANQTYLETQYAGRVTTVPCDITDTQRLTQIMSSTKPDMIMHLAGKGHHDANDEIEMNRVNIDATADLVKIAEEFGAQRFCLLSTGLVYGVSDNLRYVDETSETNPQGFYAQSKREAEKRVLEPTGGAMTRIVARLCNIFGPRQHEKDFFARIMQAGLQHKPIEITGNGSQVRQFLDIRKACEALWAAATQGEGIINIAPEGTISILETEQEIATKLGFSSPIRFIDGPTGGNAAIMNCARLRELLPDWDPSITVEALEATCAWERTRAPIQDIEITSLQWRK